MAACKVGICDSDMDYAYAFMDYINSEKKYDFDVVAFSGFDKVRGYLEDSERLDLIITDDSSHLKKTEEGFSFEDITALLMTDRLDRQNAADREDTFFYIYRFQPVSEICRQIKRSLVAADSKGMEINDILCVYSPLGRSGKTRLAKTLAGNDEVRGGIYVGMENFSDRPEALSDGILYSLKMNSSDLEETIRSSIKRESGISILNISGTYIDTNDVTFHDIELLKNVLLKSGRFTTVCFDIGSAAITDMSIFRCFRRIYMPVLGDAVSKRKIETFMKLLSDTEYKDVIRRIVMVDLPDEEAFSEEMIKTVWELRRKD